MEDIDYGRYWENELLMLLGRCLEAGFEHIELLILSVDVVGMPMIEALEGPLSIKKPCRTGRLRQAEIQRAYERAAGDEAFQPGSFWAAVRSQVLASVRETAENPQLEEFAATFCLDTSQTEIIKLLFLFKKYPSLGTFVDDLTNCELDRCARAALPDVPYPPAQFVRRSSALRRTGIVEQAPGGFSFSKDASSYRLDATIYWFLAGHVQGSLSQVFFDTDQAEGLELGRFPILPDTVSTLQVLLKRRGPTLLFFHGEPGTGKSEFTRALIRSAGLASAVLRFEEESQSEGQFRRLTLASRFCNAQREVLVVDEADNLLNTRSGLFGAKTSLDKGLINTFFDGFEGKMIFISNESDDIEKSVLRRFHFTLEFRAFGPRERLRVWRDLGARHEVFTDPQIESLAVRFQANPAQILNTLEIASNLKAEGWSGPQVLKAACQVLDSTQKLLWGTRPGRDESDTFDFRWLSLDTDAESLLVSLRRWFDTKERGESSEGLNLLFYGVPGSGKTQLARRLAAELGLPLTVKRASDLLGSFLGETERNLRKAFDEAAEGVLLLDEADSFFTDRGLATRSWERTQTNEILTCMETFRGLFIVTTNFNKLFDQASFRRFSYKVEFLPLAAEQRESLLRSSFPDLEWATSLFLGLAGLTPGDVKAVQRRLRFQPAPTAELVVEELRKDLKLRSKERGPVGFTSN